MINIIWQPFLYIICVCSLFINFFREIGGGDPSRDLKLWAARGARGHCIFIKADDDVALVVDEEILLRFDGAETLLVFGRDPEDTLLFFIDAAHLSQNIVVDHLRIIRLFVEEISKLNQLAALLVKVLEGVHSRG